MADTPDNLAPPSANPIFPDLDIPCPHCEYNLRRLTDPLCPECGEPFDPAQAERKPRRLAVLQAACLIWRCPVRFWRIVETPPHEAPSWRWRTRMAASVAALAIVLALVLPVTLAMLDSRPIRDPGPFLMWFAVCWFIVTLAVVILVESHRFVCYLRLQSPVSSWKPASRIAGFSQAWTVPALALVLMIYLDSMLIESIQRSIRLRGWNVLPHHLTSLQASWLRVRLELIGATLACIPWIITVYVGALRVRPPGRRAVAAYCALCNPLLWASVLLVAFSVYRVIPFLRQMGIL